MSQVNPGRVEELRTTILEEAETLTDEELEHYLTLISSSKHEAHQGRVPAPPPCGHPTPR